MPTVKKSEKSKETKETKTNTNTATTTSNKNEKAKSSALKSEEKAKSAPPKKTRVVVHPNRICSILEAAQGNALTGDQAKELLGWEESHEAEGPKGEKRLVWPDGTPVKNDWLLIDVEGNKIRCKFNLTNRPLYTSTVEEIEQDILQLRYVFNFQNIVIGKFGSVLNGQHRLIALVLACQKWKKYRGQYADFWKSEPTIDTSIGYGCDEADQTTNTMDTGRIRSESDVLFRNYFVKESMTVRKKLCKILTNAVKMLWDRTGACENPFASRRTHMELIDFVSRHKRLLEAVKHVYEEDAGERKISEYLSLGYSSAFLYLMATSETERENKDNTGYIQTDLRSEKQLDFSRWEKACDFFTLLAGNNEAFSQIRDTLGSLAELNRDGLGARKALLAKAWVAWIDGDEIDANVLNLEWATKADSAPTLVGCPTVGGVDMGNVAAEKEAD
jgi:hypothetical protein